VADHHVGTLSNHSQEVCGLRWSPDGKFLASGANDNLLCVWSAQSAIGTHTQPISTFSEHQAAVKVSSHFALLVVAAVALTHSVYPSKEILLR
jgi:cell division cycle protein 20 (cofactor of APC complex)